LRLLGGKTPFIEFQKQVIHWFSHFFEAVEQEALEVFSTLTVTNGTLDLDKAGISAPSATWTYQVNDSLFEDIRDQLLTQPGYASIAALLAGPLLLFNLWLGKRRHKKR